MRTIRKATITILALGLMAGSTVGVAAQEVDLMAPSTFTTQGAGEPKLTTDPGTGATIVEVEKETTDQRASGTWTEVVAGPTVPGDEAAGLVQRMAVRIVNDGGSWVGSSRGFMTFPSDGPPTVQFFGELVGEGGYEGLSMLVSRVGVADDFGEIGVIRPSDEIPAIPDLPAE